MAEIYDVKERVIEDNDAVAQIVRESCRSRGVFLINLMGSPGAGKTSVLKQTIARLPDPSRIGVLEADVDSDLDARAVEKMGARAVQLHTGGSCHMDADMTRRGLSHLNLEELDLVVLENVGNLVCPAEFDVGQNLRAMILSVPEGDDKPLKYPLMFRVSDVLLVNKIDTAEVFDFSMARLQKNLAALHPDLPVFPLSAKTGEGVDEWVNWLKDRMKGEKEDV